MSNFSITLIEYTISEAANIILVIGEQLTSYRLSIVRDMTNAVAEPEPTDIILLAVSQLSNDLSSLSTLCQIYPDVPIILLTPPEVDETLLLQALEMETTDYVVLSKAGLLTLGRRLAKFSQSLQERDNQHKRWLLSERLREISVVIATLNLDELLGIVLEQLNQIIRYDSAVIFLVKGEQHKLAAGHGIANRDKVIGQISQIKPEQNIPNSIVIQTHKSLIVDNISEIYPDFEHAHGHQAKSWLGIPLVIDNRVIGMISIARTESRAYNEDEAEIGLAFGHQVAVAIENARLHGIAVNSIERELQIAQEIQETLLPQVLPQVPGLQISGRILPARQVGGDFFHFFPVSGGNQLGVAVGDVSGKGIPAALYMAVAITAIDIEVRTDPPPGELMNRLNQALYNRLQENKMNIGLQVAIFEPLLSSEGEIDTEARGVLMTAASGGMIAPIGATERGCRFLPVSGLPIGALPPPDQTYEDDMFLLDPFTTIIFTTDGIVEAKNEAGELFGFDRLEVTINEIAGVRNAETVAEYIIDAAQKFMGEAEQSDDMTVVVVVKT
jgi:sigma-B regulation protein RsbU (phosphoserine phosphatase)